ncbi:MAG: hypothetical protein NXI22_01205 [bacterium]|nr:hypothetical protein [bacterium]
MQLTTTRFLIGAFFGLLASVAAADELGDAIKAIQSVGPEGKGHRQAASAWKTLAQADAEQLPTILAGFDGANVLAENWIRAAVDAVAERTLEQDKELPQEQLEAFLADTKHSPRGRRTAYEWITQIDPTAEKRLIPGMLNDPSLELRRDAVAYQFEKAEQLKKEGKNDEALFEAKVALSSARNIKQVQAIAKFIRDNGGSVDLVEHFGFLTDWHLVAPFDNVDKAGFNVAYPPEESVSLTAAYQGKEGEVTWKKASTEDELGMVDLNKILGKEKGAIAYAYTEFESKTAQPAELRLGCINGNKVWLNGELLTANEVYHSNTLIDQYVGRGKLKKGTNTILLKIAQNEQTEGWAQRWQFQIRVCNSLGTAILDAAKGSASDSSSP